MVFLNGMYLVVALFIQGLKFHEPTKSVEFKYLEKTNYTVSSIFIDLLLYSY